MSTRILNRPLLGIALGAVTGGVLAAVFLTLSLAMAYPVPVGTFVPDRDQIADWAVASFVLATITWSLGLALVGYPLWRVLDRRGINGPSAASLFGVFAVYLVSLLLVPTADPFTPELPRMLLAASGGVVGLVIQRVAYSSPKPPKPSPVRLS